MIARASADGEPGSAHDDSLLLMFLCCHPSLAPAAAIPLTLRAVGGLTTREIATAFLVPEATMAQRISRAKARIHALAEPFTYPPGADVPERVSAVNRVLYLMFNEGYTTSHGTALTRPDLSNEAIRLARSAHEARPDDPEVTGLLALMVLSDARRAARTGPSGELIPGSRSSTRSPRTSTDTTASTPPVPICSNSVAMSAPPSTSTGWPRVVPPADPNRTTSRCAPLGSAPSGPRAEPQSWRA